ncbi:hypothetical protein [Nonomuraea rhodomycinica]|uniref:Uncharacterized protein n=1 Tax=Nonomuraea rhodomycinica TaxID=1712872 RepID=A0A7Y6IXN8_9ACTN|nr:hypothetical protein [Nonomuraea rhodomycinica]NUW45758.1 hypothetical protein [Nonomuraea rhodomycinica]
MADNPLIVVPAPTWTPGDGSTWCTLSPNGSPLALTAYRASGADEDEQVYAVYERMRSIAWTFVTVESGS